MSATRLLAVQPLRRESFARFGDVIEIEGARSFAINDGTAQRFNDLARIDVSLQEGRPALSIFRGQPASFPLQLAEVERHPLGSQAFVPLAAVPFLIVVAADGADDGPGEPFAFLSSGRQGVNYHRGVWHHRLLSLRQESDFVVIDRAGAGENCEVARLSAHYLIEAIPA